ncbi:hypothetical protein D9M71_38950 [compost metagenome]
MPIYRVQAPDGSILRIEGPPLASEDELKKTAESYYQQATTPSQPAAEKPGISEAAQGAGEAALTLGTGATSGAIGMIGGTLKGLAEQILSGQFGTPQAADLVQQEAMKGAEALTYAPRTQSGQEIVQGVAEVAEPLAAIAPMTAELQAIGSAAKIAPAARAATGEAVQQARQTAAPVVDAAQRLRNVLPGTESRTAGRSAGAAATELETLRREKAAGLPVPIKLTKGEATRDAEQLAFEKEKLKAPEGEALRQRANENNLQAMQNFDALIDLTGAESADLVNTGNRVIDALGKGWKQAKAQTNAAYADARRSPEAQNPVDLRKPVSIGEGDQQVDGTFISYINGKTPGLESSKVTDQARKIAVRLGIAAEDADGNLVPGRASVSDMESFRSELTGIADRSMPRQIRDETILKKMVDAQVDPVAGDKFRNARKLREQQARKFETRGIVANLITNRRGMDDPKIAADQVLRRSVLTASPEEVTFLKRVMNTSGEDGKQAWKDVQGALLNHIREESSKGMGLDANDQPIMSAAKLNNVVNQLDRNERLDIVLGKQNAQKVRDLNDVLKYVNTVPPGTLINNSGTVGMLMAAMAEAGTLGATTGLPVPVITGLKALSSQIKSAKIKAKIKDALGE